MISYTLNPFQKRILLVALKDYYGIFLKRGFSGKSVGILVASLVKVHHTQVSNLNDYIKHNLSLIHIHSNNVKTNEINYQYNIRELYTHSGKRQLVMDEVPTNQIKIEKSTHIHIFLF